MPHNRENVRIDERIDLAPCCFARTAALIYAVFLTMPLPVCVPLMTARGGPLVVLFLLGAIFVMASIKVLIAYLIPASVGPGDFSRRRVILTAKEFVVAYPLGTVKVPLTECRWCLGSLWDSAEAFSSENKPAVIVQIPRRYCVVRGPLGTPNCIACGLNPEYLTEWRQQLESCRRLRMRPVTVGLIVFAMLQVTVSVAIYVCLMFPKTPVLQ